MDEIYYKLRENFLDFPLGRDHDPIGIFPYNLRIHSELYREPGLFDFQDMGASYGHYNRDTS